MVIPRLLHLLTPSMASATPPAHMRAAAFSLSRMLTVTAGNPDRDIRRLIMTWLINDSFRVRTDPKDPSSIVPSTLPQGLTEDEAHAFSYATKSLWLPTLQMLQTLASLITNTDPTPDLVTFLLRPVVPHMYSLRDCLKGSKTADPTTVEIVEGLLFTWARSIEKDEVVAGLWKVIEGECSDWEADGKGFYHTVPRQASSKLYFSSHTFLNLHAPL